LSQIAHCNTEAHGLFEKAYEGDLQAFFKESINMKASVPNAESTKCMHKTYSYILPISSDHTKLCAQMSAFMCI